MICVTQIKVEIAERVRDEERLKEWLKCWEDIPLGLWVCGKILRIRRLSPISGFFP